MKHHLAYIEYVNRVHGCWLGKCIACAAAGPQPAGNPHGEDSLDNPVLVADDELCLQARCLDVLERKGIQFTPDDLAEAFAGQHPDPTDCASDLWACIAPGNPELAAGLVAQGARPEDPETSLHAGQFLAAAKSLAFIEPDLDSCLDAGQTFIPKDSEFHHLVEALRNEGLETPDWRAAHKKLACHCGFPGGVGPFQDIVTAVFALLYGGSDFNETLLIARESGSGRACATAGALLGIHHAATGLMNRYGFRDQSFRLCTRAQRRSDRICDFADDVAMAGLAFQEMNAVTRIEGGGKPPLRTQQNPL